MGELAKKVGELCRNWSQQILDRADQASAAAKAEAVEDYVLYLFLEPGDPPRNLLDFLRRERGFDDVNAIRSGQVGPRKKQEEVGGGFSI